MDDDADDVSEDDDVKDKVGDLKAKSVNDGNTDGMGNLQRIAKLEHEIKTLRANFDSDLVILQRMTSSPNHKNPYGKFDEWSLFGRRTMLIRR